MFFDITTKENALKFLNEFTRVDIDCIKSFIAKHVIHTDICTDATSLTAKNFINENNIDVNKLQPENVFLCAIHYT